MLADGVIARHEAPNSLCAFALSSRPSVFSPAYGDVWPPLPRNGYITGRVATLEDIKEGNLLFVASNGDTVVSKPLSVAIPQYAYWYSKGQRIRVILVQAEEAQGKRIYGVRDVNWNGILCTGAEQVE